MMASRALHIGPTTSQVGGMETVLRAYKEAPWDQLKVEVVASTQRGGAIARITNAISALNAARTASADTVIHVHLSQRGSFVREGLIAVAAARRHRVYATIHGSSFTTSAQNTMWRRVYASVLKRMSAVGVLNQAAAETARRLAPHLHIEHLPNPGPVFASKLESRSKTTPRQVVFAGAVGHRKGVDVLAKAWPTVLSRVPDANLKLIGPSDGTLSQSVMTSIAPNCLGSLDPATTQDQISQAACAVLASRAEGQPMFLIEALGLGVPIVATEVGGMPGLAAGTGLIVPVDDAPALAEALIAVLTDVELATGFSENALAKYEREFSFGSHEKRLVELYTIRVNRRAM